MPCGGNSSEELPGALCQVYLRVRPPRGGGGGGAYFLKQAFSEAGTLTHQLYAVASAHPRHGE